MSNSEMEQQVGQTASNDRNTPNLSTLMERVYMFMEDGDFKHASEYIERVLDIDPKYAPAYAAKTCVDLKLKKESDLAEVASAYENNPNWQKALRFANEEQKATYQAYTEQLKARVQKKFIKISIAAVAAVIAIFLLITQVIVPLTPGARFAVGNYIEFGTYPQTRSGTDSTPIEWLVLARDGNKALLISRYGLDAQPYNTEFTDVTWETCTLRTWLNGTFMNKAFTTEEQKAIQTTMVDNSSSQCYSKWSTNGGNNTQDKVFLLSYAEANKYFGVEYRENSGADLNTKSRVAPTAYAEAQGASTYSDYKTADGDSAGWWWLRSPGDNSDWGSQNWMAGVDSDGDLCSAGCINNHVCVRPALWVNLDSGIF